MELVAFESASKSAIKSAIKYAGIKNKKKFTLEYQKLFLRTAKMTRIINNKFVNKLFEESKNMVTYLDFITPVVEKVPIMLTDDVRLLQAQQNFGWRITTSQEFKQKIDKEFHFVSKILALGNVVIAGGFVSGLVLSDVYGDIDFFFYDLNEFSKKNIIKRIFEVIYEHFDINDHDTFEYITYNNYVISFYDRRTRQKYQFIIVNHKNKMDVINNFDLGSSMIMYDGENVILNGSGAFSYGTHCNILRSNFNYRHKKYLNRGFSLIYPHDYSNFSEHNKEMYEDYNFGPSTCICFDKIENKKMIDSFKWTNEFPRRTLTIEYTEYKEPEKEELVYEDYSEEEETESESESFDDLKSESETEKFKKELKNIVFDLMKEFFEEQKNKK
jgi:hypothetical protein